MGKTGLGCRRGHRVAIWVETDDGYAVRCLFFFSSRRRHTRFDCDWSSDVCSSDLLAGEQTLQVGEQAAIEQRTPEQVAEALYQVGGRDVRQSDRHEHDGAGARTPHQIGRAAGRERVEISVGAGSFKKKKEIEGSKE